MSTEEYLQIHHPEYFDLFLDRINFYFKNDGKELHKVVKKIFKSFTWMSDFDDYYSLAHNIFLSEVLPNYSKDKGDFDGWLYHCMRMKLYTGMTAINREKRTPYLRDKNGKAVEDEDGKKIRVPLVYLDAPIDIEGESSLTVGDTIESDFNIDKEVFEKNVQDGSKVDMFMKRLSKKEQRIVEMCVSGYKPFEIREALHITQKQYANYMEDIRSYENISILF